LLCVKRNELSLLKLFFKERIMDELLRAIKQKIADMKKIELTGFTNTETATAYFQEKEAILEGIVKTLETISVQESGEVEALKITVKALREEIKGEMSSPRELSRRELLFNLGKGIAAAWSGNHKTLHDLSFSPNLKSENWTNPKDVVWGEKGWTVNKAALGEPMGNMATNDQYLINPIYETEIMTDVAKKSVMMSLVRHRPMLGPSIFLPTRDRGGVQLNWLTAYGQKIEGSKPKGAERVELKAYTLAGYIPWFDEFEEDVFVDLGAMLLTSLSKLTDRSLTANVC
jgi:HK97 family phage major capsid protein